MFLPNHGILVATVKILILTRKINIAVDVKRLIHIDRKIF